MSSDVAWAITRNNSSFLLKKRGCPKPFSTDPMNLTNKNSLRYNGYLQRKAVGISATDEKKGFSFTMKRTNNSRRPGKNLAKVDMKSGARSSLRKLRSAIEKQRYRKDLKQAALRRASAIIKSQKTFVPKRGSAKVSKKD